MNPAGATSHAVTTGAAVRGWDVVFIVCYETQNISCMKATWGDNSKCFTELASSDYVLVEALLPVLRADTRGRAFDPLDYRHNVLPFVEELQAAVKNWAWLIVPAPLLTRRIFPGTGGGHTWPGQIIMILAPGEVADNPEGAV